MLFGIPTVYIWVALAIIFFIVEVATTDIVSIWFALGALAACIVAWIAPGAGWLQFVVFFGVSILAMYYTRPILTKKLLKKTPTNADMLIGKTALVVEKVAPNAAGRVKMGDLTWQAKSDSTIPQGEMCRIVKIEGASLIVEKISVSVNV